MITERRIRAAARKAIALIKKHGWAQQKSRPEGPARCAYHALYAADLDILANTVARAECLLYQDKKVRKLSGRKRALARWNDAPGRTKKEVLELLQRVANGERADIWRLKK